MKAYYFVDSDGTENVSNIEPSRFEDKFWIAEQSMYRMGERIMFDAITELPKGTIMALFGVNLTFNDEPILITY